MLTAENIVKRYRVQSGVVNALEDVSVALDSRERLGLLGRSGSGKSTLGLVMAFLLPTDGGRVLLDDVPVRGWGVKVPREIRRQVQMMWQSPRLAVDPRLRLRDAILEPLKACGELPDGRAERAALLEAWATRVGLTEELLERHPHEVSDGQLQRACLARALVLHPRYLVCDEISSMLDVSTQAALLQTIAAQQDEQGFGVLFITHDLVLVRHWCQRVVRLADGKVLAEEEVLAG
jgi:peptide/nickel transport system ATP-binding protein